jgi:hypothetical protein
VLSESISGLNLYDQLYRSLPNRSGDNSGFSIPITLPSEDGVRTLRPWSCGESEC